MNIENSRAIVTGGASGLGAAVVRRLLSGGARVLAADIQEKALRSWIDEFGERIVIQRTDVASEREAAAAVDRAADEFGGLDILVNCAGVAIAEKVVGKEGPHSLDRFRRVIEVNLVGTFNMLRLAAALMQENDPGAEGERGVIVNTASVAAYEGQMGQAAYAASKAGIVGLTLPAARDLARDGIRVCAVAPGIFDTPLLAGLPEKARESLGRQTPFPSRLGRPEEFAALTAHIIENPMLNGETIRLDGALRMAPR
jgi:NAD(P)-dependent dehydrogenase (short-subunit alcohol dehydrogenase family)